MVGSLPQFAKINAATLGDNQLVAAVTGLKIRVLAFVLVASAAVTVKFKSGATTDLTGGMSLAANGSVSSGFSPVGLFETAAGEALNLNLSGAVNVSGFLVYVEVK